MVERRYRAHSEADPATVWGVLAAHDQMAEWMSFVWRSRLVRGGHTDPNGVGALRAMVTLGGPVREEIVAFEPPDRLGYRMTRGNGFIRDYRGTVALNGGEDGGTEIEWTINYAPRPRWLGPVINRVVALNTHQFASGLARAAERRAA